MKTKNPPINVYSIITILIIFFIYLFIAFGTVLPKYKEVIYNNWSDYKCNPLIMPMASYYNPEVSTGDNFNTCMTQMQLIFLDLLLSPLYNILSLLQDTMTSILGVFNSLREMMSELRSRIESIITTFIEKFETIELQMRLFLIKLRSSMGKMEGVMITAEYTFIVISMALSWIFDVPGVITLVTITILVILAIMICLFFPIVCALLAVLAAGVGIAYCFDQNTLVKLEGGHYRKICELKIGDKIYLGGRITGLIRAKHNNDIYNYQGILVSGEHLVFDNSQWKKVKDCSKSEKINYPQHHLYCLLTENNQVVTNNNIIFRDFDEINDPYLNCVINNMIIRSLNEQANSKGHSRSINSELEIMSCGFSGNTLIETSQGKKYITDVTIGDTLTNGVKIVSVIKLSSKNIKMFNFHGVLVSGSNPVFEDGHWIRVYESTQAKTIDFREKYIFHLGTNNQEIIINNSFFRDYLEIPLGRLSNKIDNYIINHLNSD